MRKFLLITTILFTMLALPVSVQAKRVEQGTAEKLAKNFVEKKHGKKAKENVRLKHTAKKKMKRQGQKATGKPIYAPAPPPEEQDEPLYYAFNVNEESGGGFVIVAGDDVARPVLGYSDNGSFDEKDMPPNFAYWMDFLQGQIAEAIGDGVEQDEATKMEWEEYIGGMAPESVVEPLVKAKWNQGAPYNNMTPMDGEVHSLTGCVATAMAQIMKFHNHPVRGTGQSEPYTTGTLKIEVPSINFEIDYDWGNMLNTYTKANPGTEEQQNAVATLMYHAGASLKINYTSGGSGAVTMNIAKMLTKFFGYAKDIQHRERKYYSNAAWDEMLREHLNTGLPMVYRGQGHAFISDGYDNTGKFHFNWGHGGNGDGYFVSNALRFAQYNIGQFVLANIKPDEGQLDAYDLALTSLSANKNSATQNELFTVRAQIKNLSMFGAFPGGHWGLALVNNEDKAEIIGIASRGKLNARTNASAFTINSFIPENIEPGEYKLMIAARPTDGEWELISKSAVGNGVSSAINFTVAPYQGATPGGGYGLALIDFRSERTYAIYGESTQFSISSALRNISLDQFPAGQVGAALVDNNDKIVEIIGSANFNALNAAANRTAIINATIPATVAPGVYRLRTIAMQPANGDWHLVTMSLPGIPNSIDFGVIEPGAKGKVTFASADGNGTLTASVDGNAIASGASVELGKRVAFKAVPNSAYIVAGWTVNGVEVLGNATETLEITHFRNETIVTAIFKEKNIYQKVADYALATENAVITVGQNYTLDALVNIPAPAKEGTTLTIKSTNPSAPVTLRRGKSGNLFTVSSGATLVLENIIIHGGDDGYSDSEEAVDEDELESGKGTLVMVNDGGKFEMNDGTVLRNNANLSAHGGAVIVNSGGLFTMNGGNIAYNTTNIYDGGGVYLNGGTFSMAGGSITDNDGAKGGGIMMASGTFTMSGGEISGNTGAIGGAVRVNSSTSVFTMQSGKISGNSGTSAAGGVSVIGTFTMNGGEISNNIAATTSGGVATSGTFTMNAGKISGNIAETDGGGVRVSDGTFTMNGGEISGNTASLNGGGIRLIGGKFTMQAGKISGNTAIDGGGLSMIGTSTAFTMNGGEIIGNTAGTGGGGIRIGGGTFTINGGEIIGNTATTGKGIHRAGGTVNLNGGVVSGIGANIAAVVNGTHNLNKGEGTPNNAAIIAWDKPSGEGPCIYEQGTSTSLTISSGATAAWANKDSKIGISYKNADNEGFIETANVALKECDAFCQFTLQIASYPTASENVVITVSEDFTFRSLIAIPTPTEAGRTLTIRGADLETPVTLTRGITGNLFTVSNRATLIFENIIIDGGKEGSFENGGGVLATISSGGTLVMKDGSVLRNNVNTGNGGAVYINSNGIFDMIGGEISGNTAATGGGVRVNSATSVFTMKGGKISNNFATSGAGAVSAIGIFTMDGGEISGNTSATTSGGVATSGTFTMNAGKIFGNTAGTEGGGVRVSGGTFTMNGGEINGNTASTGNGIRRSSGTVNLNGGVVSGIGANIAVVVNGTHNLNKSEGSPNNAAIIAWNKPASEGPYIYEQGASTNLIISAGATAVWENKDDKIGISYKNTDNEGFMEIANVTLIGDNIDIALAKAAIEKTNFGSVSQETLNTQEEAKSHVESIISALELNGVNATVADGVFTAASDGTDGSYTFTVKLNKGTGIEQVTEILTLGIIAAPYGTSAIPLQIAKTTIKAHYANKTIMLENVPQGARVQVYNLQGKQIYSANPENPKILKIGVQTGVYIVKINNQTLRIAAR